MKWFKHDSDAHRDAKLKRVQMKYGMEGYGLYWYCIELIAGEIDQHNITFELEHDADIIGSDTGISPELVQEMMTYMVNLGLFENTKGTITCLQLAKRLDKSMTSNVHMRQIIEGIRENHDSVMTNPDLVSADKNRLEEKRLDKNTSQNSVSTRVPFQEIISLYHDTLPELPRVEKLTDQRKKYIRQRWIEDLTELEHWKNYFLHVKQSKFLLGKTQGGRPWRANLEWLTKPANFAKVSEDLYHE